MNVRRGFVLHPAQTVRSLFFLLICCLGFANLNAQSIQYHGGFLISPAHVYFIWYGNWNGDTGSIILPDLINGMNGSSYLNVLTSYSGKIAISSSQSVFASLTNNVTFGGQVWDWYSRGSVIDDTTAKDIVESHLGQFGTDPLGVYFLFTAADVRQTRGSEEFCFAYCGYHGRSFRDNINMAYAVVGNPARCPAIGSPKVCKSQSSSSPNDNTDADGMATTVAHEYTEIVTDVNGDAWYSNADGEEMGDLCQFSNNFGATYGSTFFTGNGSLANVTLGSRNFLLQQLWAATGGCTLSYTPPPPPPGGGGGGGGGGGTGCSTLQPTTPGRRSTRAGATGPHPIKDGKTQTPSGNVFIPECP
jgi:hypothetical protein